MSAAKLVAIERAIIALKVARDELADAHAAPKVLVRVRSALKSAEGALRHQRLAPFRDMRRWGGAPSP